jgi:hypothetical protein
VPKMYRVYSIIERPKQDDYWLNIGAAFPHDDGKGFNVLLQALPISHDGQVKIVIREYDPAKGDDAEKTNPKK